MDLRTLLALAELPRAALEAGSLLPALPLLASAPRGDGHTVLVIPGLGVDDESTVVLRRYLEFKGYRAEPWGLGTNLGVRLLGGYERLAAGLMRLFRTAGDERVSLVGWSLGGVHARAVAMVVPLLVRQVITLGAPIGGSLSRTGLWDAYRAANPLADAATLLEPFLRVMHEPPPGIPSTAIYSRTDGVVPWQLAMEMDRRLTDNIEVYASHFGLGVNPTVLYAIADRLAQPRQGWQRFDRSGWKIAAYGPARRDE
jgi:pimeloyl-ACP methyl ester carboxylesterase